MKASHWLRCLELMCTICRLTNCTLISNGEMKTFNNHVKWAFNSGQDTRVYRMQTARLRLAKLHNRKEQRQTGKVEDNEGVWGMAKSSVTTRLNENKNWLATRVRNASIICHWTCLLVCAIWKTLGTAIPIYRLTAGQCAKTYYYWHTMALPKRRQIKTKKKKFFFLFFSFAPAFSINIVQLGFWWRKTVGACLLSTHQEQK